MTDRTIEQELARAKNIIEVALDFDGWIDRADLKLLEEVLERVDHELLGKPRED